MARNQGPLAACIAMACAMPLAASAADCVAVTAMDLFKARGNDAAMRAWRGRTVCVSGGFFGGNSGSSVNINATTTPDHTVECDVGAATAPLASMSRGQPVTAKGTVSRIFYGFGGRFQLTGCSVQPGAMPREAARQAAPADPPMGKYAVYQGVMSYQYELVLQPGGRYLHNGDAGRYSYDGRTKVLRFTSGPISGFVGKYYTSGRNNDRHEPAIAIDFDGKVPDIEHASNGQYQYAFFRP